MPPRSLLYLGEKPSDTFGSARVVARHLARLGEPWAKVARVYPPGTDLASRGEAALVLPHRLRGWPPYHPDKALLRWIREHLWAGWIARRIEATPDVILSYLAYFDPMPAGVALKLGRLLRRPVALLAHDDPAAFGATAARLARHARLAQAAGLLLPVTRELGAALGVPGAEPLLPIPAPAAASGVFAPPGRTRLLFAGNLHPGHVPVLAAAANRLAARDAELVVIAPPGRAREALQGSRAVLRDPFPTSAEALSFAAASCNGALVSYGETIAALPMARSSFPSKWMDFANAGVPCVLVLPEGSAVGRWAGARGWASTATLPDWRPFDAFVDRVASPEGRAAEAERTRDFASVHFDPAAIHGRLEARLASLAAD